MTSKSVKFEISLEKLTVKFEGDIQFAEKVQSDITGALNTLASAQQRMIAAPKPAQQQSPAVVPPLRARDAGAAGTPACGGVGAEGGSAVAGAAALPLTRHPG